MIGPDGKPVAKAIAFGRTYVPYKGRGLIFSYSNAYLSAITCARWPVRNPGMRSRETVPVLFL